MDCDTVARAVAAGEDPDAGHVAGCARCAALYGRSRALVPAPPVPSRGVFVARRRRRIAVVSALAAAALAIVLRAFTPGPPAPDLLAVLDDADAAARLGPDDDDLLALLDAEDPFTLSDQTSNALLGQWE